MHECCTAPNADRIGCRAGDACPFLHDPSLSSEQSSGQSASQDRSRDAQKAKPKTGPEASSASGVRADKARTGPKASSASGPSGAVESPRRHVPLVDRSKVVQRPVTHTQAEDPREFQLQQLRRRFSPKETYEADNSTVLLFSMTPSDPDFPFDMVGLECALHVPAKYPAGGWKPHLDVKNKEMGRGYQINVERGFATLMEKSPEMTLLGLMNALDKQLESLLTEQKAETIKIIPNAGPSTGKMSIPFRPIHPPLKEYLAPSKPPACEAFGGISTPTVKPPTFTPEQKRDAAARREMETRQLEARLGRLPQFKKSSDGIVYTLPIEPRKRTELPEHLRMVKTMKLFVPLMYPLEPCRIELPEPAKATAISTEKAFERRARENPDMTLIGHINHLTQNMHLLHTEPIPVEMLGKHKDDHELVAYLKRKGLVTGDTAPVFGERPEEKAEPKSEMVLPSNHSELDDRSHVKVILRPPEWTVVGADGEEEDDLSDSYDSGDEFSDEDSGVELDTVQEEDSRAAPERGILLSFPYLELHGIELLELTSLCLTIKCERCKDQMDIKNLRTTTEAGTIPARSESCKKCASSLGIGLKPKHFLAQAFQLTFE
jgi:hypothetical protein